MNEPIHLSYDIRAYNEPAIASRMLHRHIGRLTSISFFLIPLLVAVGVGVLAGRLFLGLAWGAGAMVASYAGVGYFFAAFVIGLRHRKRIAKMLQDSPLRANPYEITLSKHGVERNGQLYPWSVFPNVMRLPGMTVLQFSATEGIFLPDKQLPTGLTPDTVQQKIDQWRKAAI